MRGKTRASRIVWTEIDCLVIGFSKAIAQLYMDLDREEKNKSAALGFLLLELSQSCCDLTRLKRKCLLKPEFSIFNRSSSWWVNACKLARKTFLPNELLFVIQQQFQFPTEMNSQPLMLQTSLCVMTIIKPLLSPSAKSFFDEQPPTCPLLVLITKTSERKCARTLTRSSAKMSIDVTFCSLFIFNSCDKGVRALFSQCKQYGQHVCKTMRWQPRLKMKIKNMIWFRASNWRRCGVFLWFMCILAIPTHLRWYGPTSCSRQRSVNHSLIVWLLSLRVLLLFLI